MRCDCMRHYEECPRCLRYFYENLLDRVNDKGDTDGDGDGGKGDTDGDVI